MHRALAVLVLFAPTVAAQWNTIDRSLPWATEACAGVNYQLERWETAVHFYELLTRQNPEDAFSQLWLARSLTELGEHERGAEVASRATQFPAVRAHAFLQLARNQAALGREVAALTSLELAADAELVDIDNVLKKDPLFATLRKDKSFKEVAKSTANAGLRMNRLSNSGDLEALTALVYANQVLVRPDTNEPIEWILGELLEYVDRARRGTAKDEGRERLLVVAQAVDATLEEGRVLKCVEAWLSWNQEELDEQKKEWKQLEKLASGTRSHRFDSVIKNGDALAESALARGDLFQFVHSRLAASLCHLAIIDYKQPRRGISAEEETRRGAEKAREALVVARSLGQLSVVLRALDYLCSHEIHFPSMSESEFDELICEAVALSSRLVPKENELGMWQDMWRQRRGKKTR